MILLSFPLLASVIVFVFGAIVGSFLNVASLVAHRFGARPESRYPLLVFAAG